MMAEEFTAKVPMLPRITVYEGDSAIQPDALLEYIGYLETRIDNLESLIKGIKHLLPEK